MYARVYRVGVPRTANILQYVYQGECTLTVHNTIRTFGEIVAAAVRKSTAKGVVLLICCLFFVTALPT